MYTVHLWLVGKPVVDFLLVLIELFSPAFMVEALRGDIGRNCGVRKRGWSIWPQVSGGRGYCPPTTIGVRKLASLSYHVALFCVILRLAVLIEYRRVTDTETQ